jgi:hypothetical protein
VDELRKNSGRLFGQYAVNESSIHTGRMWFGQKRGFSSLNSMVYGLSTK